MTRLISTVIFLLVLAGLWQGFRFWQEHHRETEILRENAARQRVNPEDLPGMPFELQTSLSAAQRSGPAGLRAWLRTYDRLLQDPRKAWIELDYCVMVARENPQEARRIFAEVKQRTVPSSPVWPRVQELRQTYE